MTGVLVFLAWCWPGSDNLLAQLAEPVVIELGLVNIKEDSEDPEYKLGINIGFDSDDPKLYEFDTGAAGFFAAYYTQDPTSTSTPGTVSWWDGGSPTGDLITMTYTSGNVYQDAEISTTNLSFYNYGVTDPANPVATISNVNVARIGVAMTVARPSQANPSPTPQLNTDWYKVLNDAKDIEKGRGPLEKKFYGDFGMGLYRNQGSPANTELAGIFAILPQFQFASDSGVFPGFIVRTGGYPTDANPDPMPTVQVGITQENIDSFPFSIPLQSGYNGSSGNGILFPASNAPTYDAAAILSGMDIELAEVPSQSDNEISILLDTGAPSTVVHQGTELSINEDLLDNDALATGAIFTLSSSPWAFSQIQNGLRGQGNVSIDLTGNPYAPPEGYINSGITLFFNYDVMYDLENGFLRLLPNQPYEIPIYRKSGTQDFVIYASMGFGVELLPYLLDTGSPHAFVTYGSWWQTPPPTQTSQGANLFVFGAGFGYYWTPWSTIVTLGTQEGQVLATTAGEVNVGLITNVDDSSDLTPQESAAAWQAAYNRGETPFTGSSGGSGTFGNFGAGLYGSNTIATILAQLPLAEGLSAGFVIDSGGPTSTQGTLTIGLSEATIQEFMKSPGAIILPMAALRNGDVPQLLAGGAPAYQATQVTSSIVGLNGNNYMASVPTIFDTGGGQEIVFYQNQMQGAPDRVPNSLIAGAADHGKVLPGTVFSLSGANQAGEQETFLSFVVQNTLPAQNTLDVDANLTVGIGGVRINTGIQVFNEYKVMFNLEAGLLGLLPIDVPPAPTPTPAPTPIPAPPTVKISDVTRSGPEKKSVRIRGTAESSVSIKKVTYSIGNGQPQKAKGTSRWSFEVKLSRRMNRIVIEATDTLGQSSEVVRKIRSR